MALQGTPAKEKPAAFVPIGTWRGAAQQKVNRRGDRLDVAVFLSSYVAEEVVEKVGISRARES